MRCEQHTVQKAEVFDRKCGPLINTFIDKIRAHPLLPYSELIGGGSSKAEPPTFDAQPRRRPKQLVGPQVWAPRRAAFERATKRTVPPATIPPRLASPWLTRSLPLRRSPIAACVPAHLVDTPARSLQQRCATGAGSRPSGASQTRAKRRLTACERGRAPFPPRNLRPRGSVGWSGCCSHERHVLHSTAPPERVRS